MEPLKEEDDGQVLNDQAFLEMSNQLMEKFKDCEYLTNKLSRENIELKKCLMTLYGLIRTIDTLVEGISIDDCINNLIEVARGIASQYVEQHCFEND